MASNEQQVRRHNRVCEVANGQVDRVTSVVVQAADKTSKTSFSSFFFPPPSTLTCRFCTLLFQPWVSRARRIESRTLAFVIEACSARCKAVWCSRSTSSRLAPNVIRNRAISTCWWCTAQCSAGAPSRRALIFAPSVTASCAALTCPKRKSKRG